MKKIAVKAITISSLILVVSLFIIILFSNYKSSNSMAFVVENDNLSKMDDNTSLRFNEALDKEEEKDEVIDDKEEEKVEETVETIESVEVVSESVVETTYQ